jgi:hypothetical protein
MKQRVIRAHPTKKNHLTDLNVKQSGDHHHQTATIGSSVQNDDVHDGFAD